jgi:hypothetical protein
MFVWLSTRSFSHTTLEGNRSFHTRAVFGLNKLGSAALIANDREINDGFFPSEIDALKVQSSERVGVEGFNVSSVGKHSPLGNS